MAPFVETVGWFGRATQREFAKVKTEDKNNIQTHTDYVTMLVSMFYSSRMVNSFGRLDLFKQLALNAFTTS